MRKLHNCWLLLICSLFAVKALAQVSLPADVERGRDWLSAQVRSDGTLIGEANAMATVTQTRTEVLDTLRRLNRTPTALVQRLNQQSPDASVEHLARQIVANAAAAALPPARLAQLSGGAQHLELADRQLELLPEQ